MNTKSYAALRASEDLVPYSFDRRPLGDHDVALDVAYAGICHSDIHQVREEWGPALFPMVPGHEIAGTVREVGAMVSKFKVGDRIGVGVFIDSCRRCESCQRGLQQYCAEGMTVTYNGLERDGETPTMGGYCDYFVVNEDYAVHIPENLPLEGAAPLMCAGITLYSPIRHWGVGPGKRVAVIGLGGLGHIGVKIASALGAHVSVLSHSSHKKENALEMGADAFIDTSIAGAFAANEKTFDLIFNTVSAELEIDRYLNLLKLDGTLIVIGLPGKPYAVHASTLLGARRSIGGSMIGGIPELQEMLDFCGHHSIVSDVEVISADYINTAYERTVSSDVKYRFVIDAATI